MSKIWDISQYVEANPEDYEQRWRLAKKLYMAGEYRLALEHLQVLKNNWKPKINVVRYLAATYYRINRYDESVKELNSAIEQWPDETPLREQLARMLEVADRDNEAAEVWKELLERDPGHSMARRALARLEEDRAEQAKKDEPQGPVPVSPAASGGDSLQPGIVCPRCGAQNSEEFDRCWKCHAPFLAAGSVADEVDSFGDEGLRALISPQVLSFLTGCVLLALLLLAAWLTLRPMLFAAEEGAEATLPRTVQEFFAARLVMARLVVGLAVLVAWPVSLWLALALAKAYDVPGSKILATGCFLAVLAYVLSWVELPVVGYALLAPLAIALPLMALAFRANFARVLAAWVISSVAVAAVALVSLGLLLGFDMVTEFPAIARYAQVHDGGPNPGRHSVGTVTVPVISPVRWNSTGSTWLDTYAATIACEVKTENASSRLTFELKDEAGTQVYERIQTNPYRLLYDVIPESRYEVRVAGPEGAQLELTFYGLLEPAVGR